VLAQAAEELSGATPLSVNQQQQQQQHSNAHIISIPDAPSTHNATATNITTNNNNNTATTRRWGYCNTAHRTNTPRIIDNRLQPLVGEIFFPLIQRFDRAGCVSDAASELLVVSLSCC
jgi:hypothetical protein